MRLFSQKLKTTEVRNMKQYVERMHAEKEDLERKIKKAKNRERLLWEYNRYMDFRSLRVFLKENSRNIFGRYG